MRLQVCGFSATETRVLTNPLVIEGRVRVAKSNSDGNEILLYRLGPGESCAITALTLLSSGRYPATGTAEEDVSAYALPGSLFLELTLESAEFRALVFNSVAERMAHLMALVESLAFRGVAKRLAAQLLQQEITIGTTHQTLADELGTRREVVSRILETFQQSGIVRLGRKRIEILDRQALSSVG